MMACSERMYCLCSAIECDSLYDVGSEAAMCGRYRLTSKDRAIAAHFGAEDGIEWSARYNIAPTQPIPAIRQDPRRPKRILNLLRWGLIPSWAKDSSVGVKMINARSETAAEKPAFRDAFRSRRCLIPANGFYEWLRIGKAKQPYCFEVNRGEMFAFAGLWDCWHGPGGTPVVTCTILTTRPNALLSDIHDRMPAIVRLDDYDVWLDPAFKQTEAIGELLRPFDAGLMNRYPVSARLNRVENDDPECAVRIELPKAPTPTSLFSL